MTTRPQPPAGETLAGATDVPPLWWAGLAKRLERGMTEQDKAAEMVGRLHRVAEVSLADESLSLSDRRGYTADMSLKPLHQWILTLGWSVETSTHGSVYYTKNGERLRLSSHEVPTTAERADAAEAGRWSWDRCGYQIITSLQSLERCIKDLEAFEEQIEDDAAYRESMAPGRGNQ